MRKPNPAAVSSSAWQTHIAFRLVVTFAVLLTTVFDAAAQQSGFFPPLPDAVTATATPPAAVCNLTQEFDDVAGLTSQGWVRRNNSDPIGNTNWFQGNTAVFGSQIGAPNSYGAANYQNGSGLSTISNWLITPPVTIQNGAQLSFGTRTVSGPLYPDRLQVRISTNGTSADVGSTSVSVGDFATLLLDINPSYLRYGYPNGWTRVVVTLSGITSPVAGRLALRYFAEGGGPNGGNSDYVGIDSLQYCCASCGLPTPTPSPTPPPTPTPHPSPTASSSGGLSFYGVITNCSKVSRSVPVADVIVTGVPFGYMSQTDATGHYGFTHLAHTEPPVLITFTPTKPSLAPGSTGINTLDVIATQKHFLAVGLLSGCRQTAADVNQDSAVDTLDVIAIQRFFLGYSIGLANVGKFSFNPVSRTYYLANDQYWIDQNYDALVLGDVAEPFAP